MIAIENTTLTFNPGTPNENRVFENFNLTVNKGDFVTIIGSNGAGKSTLFNLLAGTVTPDSGRIALNGRDVTKAPEYTRAKTIGRIFQDPLAGTASNMTLEDNMMVCLKKGFKGLRIGLNRARRQFFREQLRFLDMGLEDRLKDNVGLLSGGQRQALTLLMMVLSRPDLVLLDEHTAALDPRNAEIVLSLTTHFVKEYDLTTMMVTHNMQQAINLGNRLLMMDAGEVVLDIGGEEKKNLTVEKLVAMFSDIRNKKFTSDEALLSR
ncbi:ABC transporter ATP-binding protein [Desulfoluna spongiiphila]|uniref:Putative ABC transport system ATP-binding protein n=1 Tax=Desulfoluna spongiiphila TaxID=419481 RepID=A0A1G5CYF7_9BACT|nr:ATP-binding cassette domain-containing protein [Desulfoluna spongiiphila]SCY07278.1 putative ABC transport system ATP-binding protein [Desulfoluna spongiiphila]